MIGHKTENQAVMAGASPACVQNLSDPGVVQAANCSLRTRQHTQMTHKLVSVQASNHLCWSLLYTKHLSCCVEERIQHSMTPQVSSDDAWMQCKGFNISAFSPASAGAACWVCALLLLHFACYLLIQLLNSLMFDLIEAYWVDALACIRACPTCLDNARSLATLNLVLTALATSCCMSPITCSWQRHIDARSSISTFPHCSKHQAALKTVFERTQQHTAQVCLEGCAKADHVSDESMACKRPVCQLLREVDIAEF